MTYVRNYGLLAMFIMFTCNPEWVKITHEFYPVQQLTYMHDLLARVLWIKLTQVDVVNKNKCGRRF